MSEETHCSFCDAEYKEENYAPYETRLAKCQCPAAKRVQELEEELSKFNNFADQKRKLRKIAAEIKSWAYNLEFSKDALLKTEKNVSAMAKILGIKTKDKS